MKKKCPNCKVDINVSGYCTDGVDVVDIACVECKAELRLSKKGKGLRLELIDLPAGSKKKAGVERIVRMNPNGEKDPGTKPVANTLVYRPKEMD